MMIVPDDQGMGLNIPDQKFADVFFSSKLGKFFCKRNDHQMINALIGKQFYFFIQGVDQANAGGSIHYRSWMGIKSNDAGFAINFSSPFFHLGNYLLMTCMNTIKSSYGEYGIAKKG